MEERDYLKDVCVCLVTVVVVMAALIFFPGWEFGGVKVKRINIFSDLMADTMSQNKLQKDTANIAADLTGTDSGKVVVPDPVIRIEDFSADTAMRRFYGVLKNGTWKKRPVRIAFLGDSYIEADIITEDLRMWLQQTYGGRGVGFVPVWSPAGGYRLTIGQEAQGWTSYSMVYHQKADWKRLFISGEYFEPSEGATFSVKSVSSEGKDLFSEARFFFQNRGNTHIRVKVDDRDTVYRPVASDSLLQHFCLRGKMRQLDFSFSKVEGFTAFGTFLDERRGVYVDNFALRGSSGIVLSIMDKELIQQLLETMIYDLVVLEFGLNVVMPDATRYSSYRKQMGRAVEHLKGCFPETAFLLLSVADRGYRKADGNFGTRDGVVRLVEEQREIARDAGIAFWNMFEAMGGRDAMVSFVKHDPPLGNKDYTHINHLGGRKIAGELVRALKAGINE